MAKEITIQLGDREQRVTVDALASTLENTLRILHGLERQLAQSGEPIQWEIIRAGMQSPLTITFVPRLPKGQARTRVGERVVRAYVDGLRAIEREPQLPPHFDEEALEAARRLASTAIEQGASVKIFSPDEDEVELDQRVVENVQEIAAKARTYIDYGTVEGNLELISTHARDSFAIWDIVTDQRIECRVAPGRPDQLEQAKELLRKRVAVTGGIRYRNGKPQSVDVESIRSLRGQDELPQPADIGPIDITGGTNSEDYVRRLRDAR